MGSLSFVTWEARLLSVSFAWEGPVLEITGENHEKTVDDSASILRRIAFARDFRATTINHYCIRHRPFGIEPMHLRNTSLALLLSGLSTTAALYAQDPLDDAYGHAVHAYYRGDVSNAQEWLEKAIAAGSKDPRVYYYRGLCLSAASGDTSAGQTDFETAADLEINGQKVVNVGKALERVQGPARCAIESIRRSTRIASRDKYLQMQRLRYEESRRAPAVAPRDADAPPTPVPAINDPFAPGLDLNKGTPAPMPESGKKAPPATDSPFGDEPADSKPGTAPASDDPFGGSSAPGSDDPFGGN